MPHILKTWAFLGSQLAHARQSPAPTWQPLKRMTTAARGKLAHDAQRLRSAIAQSRSRLRPLEDPFDLDLGTHRWLAGKREEAYSDWLQWVLEQIRNPRDILHLLGLASSQDLPRWQSLTPTIMREFPIAFGHAGHTGRLDILIRYGDLMLIAVEVKKTDAEVADTAKHPGYAQWLQGQDVANKLGVLLAISPEVEPDPSFPFVSWGDVCIRLRRLVPVLWKDRHLTAAMILSFVAAVEQNLLGFPVAVVKNACNSSRPVLFNTRLVDHLQASVEQKG